MNKLQENKLRKIIKEEYRKIIKEETVEFDASISKEMQKKYPMGFKFYHAVTTSMFEDIQDNIEALNSGEELEYDEIDEIFSTLEILLSSPPSKSRKRPM